MRGALPAFRLCAVAPILLAGLLPFDADVQSRWTWAGAWYYPVGDSFAIGGIPPAGWQVTRNVKDGGHQGADLSFRRGGDPVRAAANGIVLLAGTGEDPGGFGVHVVVAHRADDGRLCYSVYAHLARRSVRVHPGDAVAAGQIIGRVGATGRATSPHLHFEIRMPASPDQRWEKAAVVDPIAFVAARLPGSRTDTTWARPYRLWAETAGVLAAGERADDRLDQGEWWCALAAALTLEDSALARSPLAARDQLAKAGIQLSAHPDDVSKPAEWDDVFTDLSQVPVHLWRLPVAPTPPEESTRDRADHLPMNPGSRAGVRPAPPSRADICLLLADRAPNPP